MTGEKAGWARIEARSAQYGDDRRAWPSGVLSLQTNDAVVLVHRIVESRGEVEALHRAAAEATRCFLELLRIRDREREHGSPRDPSSTNVCRASRVLALAVIRDLDDARELAERVWDPPDNRYVAPGSALCEPDSATVGLALAQLVRGDGEEARATAKRLRSTQRRLLACGKLIRFLAAGNQASARQVASELGEWTHTFERRESLDVGRRDAFDPLGTALLALGVRRGLLELVDHGSLPAWIIAR